MTQVRIATPADADQIFGLCEMIHDEIGHSPMDPDRVREHIRLATTGQDGIMGVIEEDGRVCGCIFLALMPIWYSKDWQLVELFNFVHPDHRRSDYAASLIAFAKGIAQQMNLMLMIGVTTNHRMEAKVRLYSRHLPKAGEFFIFRPS